MRRLIFLTLTTPNVTDRHLEDEIQKYNQSFRRLSNRKHFKSIAKGYVRKLEVTYNVERDDYHPHFHVLVSVNRSYFTDKRYYMSQKEWLNLWRDVTGNPDITQVHVQRVKQNNQKEYLASEIYDLTEQEKQSINHQMINEINKKV
ncbi:protein rep [Staphylococcus epidermidis]|nr:protein rep [Staphylococcus epidermidis]MCG1610247.1 protein rep [Staphylococcus epidermidis]MCG1626198.1 protein rep [Staphylococcus epidermidis]